MEEHEDLGLLVEGCRRQDPLAADRLFALVYDDLRRVAGALFRKERVDHTLDPTSLVHEAYVRLMGGAALSLEGKAHFLAIASRAMRRILVNQAKAKGARKRGGGWRRVTLRDAPASDKGAELGLDALSLERVLARLEDLDPRLCRVVELRYFGGLSVGETATVLGVSERTVKGDWSMARAWLARELEKD